MLAAASLTETFTALEKQFETDHPGVDVKLNFAGSSDLAQQIVNGAPADVFAAASDATMKTVTDAGLAAGTPTIFATNVLQIATAPGQPEGHRVLRRPRQARPQGRRLRAAGAVRGRRREDREGHRA